MASRNAWIGAGASICVAVIGGLFSLYRSSPATSSFSGEIHAPNGEAISGAKVIAAEDQNVPESAYSDENGLFHVSLRSDVTSLKITVIANGFIAVNRDVNPHRTGPEEFVLQPSLKGQPLPPKPPLGGNATYGRNSPILKGDRNNIELPHN
jgi:hypothetical protein